MELRYELVESLDYDEEFIIKVQGGAHPLFEILFFKTPSMKDWQPVPPSNRELNPYPMPRTERIRLVTEKEIFVLNL